MKNKENIIMIVVVLILVLVVGWVFLGGSTEEEEQVVLPGEYDTFAKCLYDSGLRMYGSETCSVCNSQRKLFGNSFHLIEEIECDPRNDAEEAKTCVPKNISHTPTWIHEDAEGNELFRFEAGLQTLEKLGEAAGCPLVKDELSDESSNE